MFVVTSSLSTAKSWRDAHADAKGLPSEARVRNVERHPTKDRYAYLIKPSEESESWAQTAANEAEASLQTLADDWYLVGTGPAAQVFDESAGYVTDPGVESLEGRTGHVTLKQVFSNRVETATEFNAVTLAGQRAATADGGSEYRLRLLDDEDADQSSKMYWGPGGALWWSLSKKNLNIDLGGRTAHLVGDLSLPANGDIIFQNRDDGSRRSAEISAKKLSLDAKATVTGGQQADPALTVKGKEVVEGAVQLTNAGAGLTLKSFDGSAMPEMTATNVGGFFLGAQVTAQANEGQSEPLLRFGDDAGNLVLESYANKPLYVPKSMYLWSSSGGSGSPTTRMLGTNSRGNVQVGDHEAGHSTELFAGTTRALWLEPSKGYLNVAAAQGDASAAMTVQQRSSYSDPFVNFKASGGSLVSQITEEGYLKAGTNDQVLVEGGRGDVFLKASTSVLRLGTRAGNKPVKVEHGSYQTTLESDGSISVNRKVKAQALTDQTGPVLDLQDETGDSKLSVGPAGTVTHFGYTWAYDSAASELVLSGPSGTELMRQPESGRTRFLEGADVGVRLTDPNSLDRMINAPVTAGPAQGTAVGYTFDVGSKTVAEVSAEADGSGGIQNARFSVPDVTQAGTRLEVSAEEGYAHYNWEGGGGWLHRFEKGGTPHLLLKDGGLLPKNGKTFGTAQSRWGTGYFKNTLDVALAADAQGLLIQGNGAQTADLIQASGSGGGKVFQVGADGHTKAEVLESTGQGKGLVLTSDNGSRFRLYPSDDGSLNLKQIS